MQKSKFKIIRQIAMAVVLVLPLFLKAQTLQEKLQHCPVIIENGKINYYMPQQNGAFFQFPPARKPQYVNILTVPWVQPLTQSVKDTQNQVLTELLAQSKQTNLKPEDKSLFLHKLAWCVMLQTGKAKDVDKDIMAFVEQLGKDSDNIVSSQAKLVSKLLEDYGNEYKL